MIWLYRILFVPAFILAFPYYALRMLKRGGYAKDFSHRFGVIPDMGPKRARRAWVQAVSVGEVDAVMPLVKKLSAAGWEVVVTTTTSTAYALLKGKYARDCLASAVFPIDFAPFSAAAWRAINPDVCIMMEGEVWPEHLHQAKTRGIPAVLINARLSDKSFSRYKKFPALARRMFGHFKKICVSNEADLGRFKQLGIDCDKLTLAGNIKFDTPGVDMDSARKKALIAEMGFEETSFILLGSSTWKGEEGMLVEAMQKLRADGLDCRLLLVPRHAERRNEIKPEIEAFPHCVRTQSKQAPKGNLIYLADTTGELRTFTALADLAYIGKSLFGHDGGQSPIDAAAAGVPMVYGNKMTNFKQVCKKLEEAGATVKVDTPREAIEALCRLALDAGERKKMSKAGRLWHAQNEGATDRTLAAISNLQ